MSFRQTSLAVIVLAALAGPLPAEKANLSPDQLRSTATHVITGKVNAVYERSESEGEWKYRRYVAEIRIDAVEKGDGIRKDELVYVRYWERQWIGRGRMPPSSTGHRGLPASGKVLRVYLARNAYDGFSSENRDGGWNVIGANGFEKIESPAGSGSR